MALKKAGKTAFIQRPLQYAGWPVVWQYVMVHVRGCLLRIILSNTFICSPKSIYIAFSNIWHAIDSSTIMTAGILLAFSAWTDLHAAFL